MERCGTEPRSVTIPVLKRMVNTPACVARTTAQSYVEKTYKGYFPVFADGSVRQGARSAAVAFTIHSLSLEWQGRFACFASSMTTEIVEITRVLSALTTLPPKRVELVCDSRCAIQRLARPQGVAVTTQQANCLSSTLN